MSVFISLGIVILAMLIQGFLQTSPSVFAIFYHHSLAKTTAKKADDRSLSFILGVEIATAIFFLITYFVISFLAAERVLFSPIFIWIMSGILFAETILIFFFYFRRGKKNKDTTKLFLPRFIAKSLIFRVENAKNRTDTIILGLITSALELIFTLPLFIVSSISILNLTSRFGFVFIIIYIIVATTPLFIVRIFFRTDHNLTEIQRSRVKNKKIFRFILSISYLLIAIFTLISGVIK